MSSYFLFLLRSFFSFARNLEGVGCLFGVILLMALFGFLAPGSNIIRQWTTHGRKTQRTVPIIPGVRSKFNSNPKELYLPIFSDLRSG